MPKTTKPPAYRLYKRTGQAVVTLDGRDHYLGPHGTKASRYAYDRLVGEWLTNGRRTPRVDEDVLTVTELCAAYWTHCTDYYRSAGEIGKIRLVLRVIRRLYGDLPAQDFGPLALKTVRKSLVESGIGRSYVNDQVGRAKRMFRWGVEAELIPPSVHEALGAVAGLRRGRTDAGEGERVRPVPNEFLEAIRPYVSRQVWGIIQLQDLTGMRPGEVVQMRGCDLDMTGAVWLYRPATHKTEHHGHERIVEIGPRAQDVIHRFLKPSLESFLFSPADAVAERAAGAATHRRPGQTPNRRKTKRVVRDYFDRDSYRRAIDRACELADLAEKKRRTLPADSERIIPQWHPHQLRHNYATRVRREYGIETARILLGHRSAVVTEIYAEADRTKAREIVAKIG